MRDLSAKQSRYLQDPLPTRLGNLASNLAHISSFAKGAKNPNAVERLLDESRFFIEWVAVDTDLETTAELVEIQVQLSWWYHHWQEEQAKPAEGNAVCVAGVGLVGSSVGFIWVVPRGGQPEGWPRISRRLRKPIGATLRVFGETPRRPQSQLHCSSSCATRFAPDATSCGGVWIVREILV